MAAKFPVQLDRIFFRGQKTIGPCLLSFPCQRPHIRRRINMVIGEGMEVGDLEPLLHALGLDAIPQAFGARDAAKNQRPDSYWQDRQLCGEPTRPAASVPQHGASAPAATPRLGSRERRPSRAPTAAPADSPPEAWCRSSQRHLPARYPDLASDLDAEIRRPVNGCPAISLPPAPRVSLRHGGWPPRTPELRHRGRLGLAHPQTLSHCPRGLPAQPNRQTGHIRGKARPRNSLPLGATALAGSPAAFSAPPATMLPTLITGHCRLRAFAHCLEYAAFRAATAAV